jgi:exosortase A-associated hydrolase 1
MTYEERAFAFECEGERLVGVLTLPVEPARIGVVVVAGAPQYRVGAHRQFVSLARRLGTARIAVLRFDYRGSGDATGEPRSFEAIDGDIASAIDALTLQSSVRRIVLIGLCDGASAILLYRRAHRDPRISGIVLFNPWVRSEDSLAVAHLHGYYGGRILDVEFWHKMLRGRVDLPSALRSFFEAIRALRRTEGLEAEPAFRAAMAEGVAKFGGPVLVVLGEHDLTAREFAVIGRKHPWRELLRRDNIIVRQVDGGDHTFSARECKREAEEVTLAWLAAKVDSENQ